MTITITPDELHHRLRHGHKTTLIASFWRAGEGEGLEAFHARHIPNSLFCDTARALAGIPSPEAGRNPLPDPFTLGQWFRKWGVNTDREIVVYDEGDGFFAARAWWVLTWAGLPQVSVLDGGMEAWQAAGYPIVGGPGNLPLFCNLRPNPGQLPVATYADVQRASKERGRGDYILVDCRSRRRFSGRKEALDLKVGHIPGSVNVPTLDLLDQGYGRTFKPAEVIRQRFADAGVTDGSQVIIISGSGVHSSQAILAMHLAGLEGAALFPGGFSQWCADPANPVERGDVYSLS